MDKESGKPLLDENSSEIHSTVSFVPEQADGLIDVAFKFDASGLKDKTVVVFEEVFLGEMQVLVHKDIEDEKQAVRYEKEDAPDKPPVTPPEKKVPPTPKPPVEKVPPTGDGTPVAVMVIISIAAVIGALIAEKKRRR
jgi:hypothetical protein